MQANRLFSFISSFEFCCILLHESIHKQSLGVFPLKLTYPARKRVVGVGSRSYSPWLGKQTCAFLISLEF